jgi:hypothetical protein
MSLYAYYELIAADGRFDSSYEQEYKVANHWVF